MPSRVPAIASAGITLIECARNRHGCAIANYITAPQPPPPDHAASGHRRCPLAVSGPLNSLFAVNDDFFMEHSVLRGVYARREMWGGGTNRLCEGRAAGRRCGVR